MLQDILVKAQFPFRRLGYVTLKVKVQIEGKNIASSKKYLKASSFFSYIGLDSQKCRDGWRLED